MLHRSRKVKISPKQVGFIFYSLFVTVQSVNHQLVLLGGVPYVFYYCCFYISCMSNIFFSALWMLNRLSKLLIWKSVTESWSSLPAISCPVSPWRTRPTACFSLCPIWQMSSWEQSSIMTKSQELLLLKYAI